MSLGLLKNNKGVYISSFKGIFEIIINDALYLDLNILESL